jgi:hypothetical protein
MLTGQNFFAIAESVNKKRSNANFSQCNESIKKISTEKSAYHLQRFCKEEIKILTSQNSK